MRTGYARTSGWSGRRRADGFGTRRPISRQTNSGASNRTPRSFFCRCRWALSSPLLPPRRAVLLLLLLRDRLARTLHVFVEPRGPPRPHVQAGLLRDLAVVLEVVHVERGGLPEPVQ